jgi:mono/diheme cytochrome c family protein
MTNYIVRSFALRLLLGLGALAAMALGQSKELTGDAARGKAIFERDACYQCHGHLGQGTIAGARLMQTKLSQAGFIGFVRNPPPSSMPRFQAKILPDQELADIYAYIKSVPAPKAAKDIPLLSGL